MSFLAQGILRRLPSLATLPRDTHEAQNAVTTPYAINLVFGRAPCLGLDWRVNNRSTSNITVAVDGLDYTIQPGSIESNDNSAFVDFRVTTSGASPVDIRIDAISADVLEAVAGISILGRVAR